MSRGERWRDNNDWRSTERDHEREPAPRTRKRHQGRRSPVVRIGWHFVTTDGAE